LALSESTLVVLVLKFPIFFEVSVVFDDDDNNNSSNNSNGQFFLVI
jgi:hypothetical protein